MLWAGIELVIVMFEESTTIFEMTEKKSVILMLFKSIIDIMCIVGQVYLCSYAFLMAWPVKDEWYQMVLNQSQT
jgi:hypothetical protein